MTPCPEAAISEAEIGRHATASSVLRPLECDAARKAVQTLLDVLVAARSVQVRAPVAARGIFAEYSISQVDMTPLRVGR